MKIIVDAEVERYIYSLEKSTIAKSLRTIDLLGKFGYLLGMPHSKKITVNLLELRIRGRQEIRILYCFHKEAIYLLSAFVKKSQKIPQKELEKAEKKRWGLT